MSALDYLVREAACDNDCDPRFANEAKDELAQLRAELDEARKDTDKTRKVMFYLTCYGDGNMCDWGEEWLKAHPEVKK